MLRNAASFIREASGGLLQESKHIIRNAVAKVRKAATVSHPLNAEAARRAISLGDSTGLATVGIHLNVVAPGGMTTVLHSHEFVDEFIYILSGAATVFLNEEEFSVAAGDFIGLPARGPSHSMRNTGTADLVYLVGGNRPVFDVCNYPKQGKRLYIYDSANGRARDLVELGEIKAPG
ncbi:cupin domain-containing protein [Pseudorhodoferax sp.]|uniref:cupin domain-containing protein n=1 Tax=Pseudorhodoferax sp. TaxID=1993553 RepID=UPI0039E54BB0